MRTFLLRGLAATAALTATIGPALAQEKSSEVVVNRSWDLMDLAGGGTHVGAEIAYNHAETSGFIDVDWNAIEIDLVGQFPLGDTLDLWGRIPLAFGDGEFIVGDVGVGVLAKVHDRKTSSGGRLRMGIEGGVFLPTATEPDADNTEAFTASVLSRTFLVPRWAEDHMTLRGTFGLRFETGKAFFQGDAGLDLMFETDDDGNDDDSDILLHFGVSGGAEVARGVALIGELSFVDGLDDNDSVFDDDAAVQFTGGARFRAGTMTLGPAITKSLDLPGDIDHIGLRFDVLGYF